MLRTAFLGGLLDLVALVVVDVNADHRSLPPPASSTNAAPKRRLVG
jgi:hypothetical protein